MFKYFTQKHVFIGLFAILYLAVALVSLIHSFAFFGLANNQPMAIMLGCCFEIGQMAVLMSILTSKSKTKFMPWALMTLLTIVQILGNIFSSYKYLITNSNENLRYFKEPIFVWTDLPDNVTTVIITYIVGAILPVCALAMTAMVENFLYDEDERKEPITNSTTTPEVIQESINEEIKQQVKNDLPLVNVSELPKLEEHENESDTKELSKNDIGDTTEKETTNIPKIQENIKPISNYEIDETTIPEVIEFTTPEPEIISKTVTSEPEVISEIKNIIKSDFISTKEPEIVYTTPPVENKKSHFINI